MNWTLFVIKVLELYRDLGRFRCYDVCSVSGALVISRVQTSWVQRPCYILLQLAASSCLIIYLIFQYASC